MTPRFSLIIFITISVLNLICADGEGHHHRVIIHVPYKVHTIHHTILKHVHHQDKGEDKYEVLGYTVGKPIDLSHHLGGGGGGGGGIHGPEHHHSELAQHDFGGGNELGHGGHDWLPSYGQQHDFAGGGGGADAHLGAHADADAAGAGHGYQFYGHGDFGGYD